MGHVTFIYWPNLLLLLGWEQPSRMGHSHSSYDRSDIWVPWVFVKSRDESINKPFSLQEESVWILNDFKGIRQRRGNTVESCGISGILSSRYLVSCLYSQNIFGDLRFINPIIYIINAWKNECEANQLRKHPQKVDRFGCSCFSCCSCLFRLAAACDAGVVGSHLDGKKLSET